MQSIKVCVLLTAAVAGTHGQWLNHPTPGVPRTKDGKADLSAPAPRLADGKPETERFRRIDFGHMELQITIDDPKNYTKPFTIQSNQRLRADTDILEFVCLENEKDAIHYLNR